jgi:hypothetical protein
MYITVIFYVLLNTELSLLNRIPVLEVVLEVLVIHNYGYTAAIFRSMF